MKSESNLFCSTGGRILIKPLIEFCVGNLASGSQAALEKLEKRSEFRCNGVWLFRILWHLF